MKKYLVIPAFNEQDNISPLFDALTPLQFDAIVLVDNASTDRTAQLATARGATVLSEPQRGYGAACQRGIHWITQQNAIHTADTTNTTNITNTTDTLIAFIDADLADDPAQLPQLCDPILKNESDFVVSSRTRLAQTGSLTHTQRFGNALATTLMRILTKYPYTDLGPMRAIRLSTLQQLAMTDKTWGWTLEMQFKSAQKKQRILEIDVPYRHRHAGTSKISGSLIGSVRAGWKILWTLAKLSRTTHPTNRD